MPIWIFRVVPLLALLTAIPARADVITQLPGHEKQVALTFDACESKTPAFYDRAVGDYLVTQHIPFTMFVTGRFARHNQAALKELAARDYVELENHSLDHDNHMERLSDAEIHRQIVDNDQLLFEITGRHTRFFRFPAGNYDARALHIAEDAGYKVVHWSFASGDPAKAVTPERLTDWVLARTRPGNILIFHINGRGWSTAKALPAIITELRRRGYRFTTLEEGLR
jgi:peptidoglycan/xylan/chitin deacetylase (PgdA/CDA1 family)